jgi:hypothetical protein
MRMICPLDAATGLMETLPRYSLEELAALTAKRGRE